MARRAIIPAVSSSAPVISLVGLGVTGIALGRQLARVGGNFKVVGYDEDPDRIKAAGRVGAIHQGQLRLDRAVEGARLVILAEPPGQIVRTLEVLGEALRPDAIVTDVAPEKERILEAAQRLLPATVSFIGGHPILRASALSTEAASTSEPVAPRGSRRRVPTSSAAPDAGANPFADMPYCLIPLPNAAPEAVQMVVNLVHALDAEPLFIGAAEHDGLVAGVHLLPRLVALAQLGIAGRSASVRDLERLAGSGLQFALEADAMDEDDVLQAIEAHPREVLAWLDPLLAELGSLRAELAAGEAGRIASWIETTKPGRARWRQSAAAPGQPSESFRLLDEERATGGGFFGRLGFGRRRPPGQDPSPNGEPPAG